MKALFFSFLTLCSTSLFAQTKAIAYKSHSGDLKDYQELRDGDNFGLPPRRIDTLKKISENCVVEIPNYGQNDTVCDHPYFNKGYTMEEIKNCYSWNTVFIGFETEKKLNPKKKENGLDPLVILILVCGIAGGLFAFRPSKRKLIPIRILPVLISMISCFAIGSMGMAQTANISRKSHSGSTTNLQERDRFGEYSPPHIDTVIRLKNKCIVEIRFYSKDTICDHPYFNGNYDLKQVKSYYSNNTVFIGFEKDKIPPPGLKRPLDHQKKELLPFLILIGLGTSLLFVSKKRNISVIKA